MVDRLILGGSVGTSAVERALRSVPRHLFVPDAPLSAAYTDEPVVTQVDADGSVLNSASQPSVSATVLEQLGVAPGDRVLEIGTGSGYDAALLAELVGSGGRVVTIEVDPVMACEAREHLVAAGYERVEVLCGDGWAGAPTRAPFDRLVSTVGVWDISPAWLDQLDAFGMAVLPLWLRAGLQVTVALRRDCDRLTSTRVCPCGVMRLRGRGAGPEAYVTVNGRAVCLEDAGPGVVDVLAQVLDRRASVVPLGRPLRSGWFTGLALAAPDAVQMAWSDPVRGTVTASGVFDAYRGGLALVVPGRGGAEMHSHGDPAAADRLRTLLGRTAPVGIGELRFDLVFGEEPVRTAEPPLAVLRRPHATVVVSRRGTCG